MAKDNKKDLKADKDKLPGVMSDFEKKLLDKKNGLPDKIKEKLSDLKDSFKEGFKEGFSKLPGAISDFEKKLLNKKNKKRKTPKQDSLDEYYQDKERVSPRGTPYLYAKKGGLVKNKTSKVAGKLAIRGYGKAMKGKK